MARILFVGLPAFLEKKPGQAPGPIEANLNLGLLSVATAASRQGLEVKVLDWLGPHQTDLMESLPEILDDFRPHVVGFSVFSGYAEPYLALAGPAVRSARPSAFIVVGGQFHAALRAPLLLGRFPWLDAVAIGAGEGIKWRDCLRGGNTADYSGLWTRRGYQEADTAPVEPEFDWELLALDVRQYAPSVEIARGCPYRCAYCSSAAAPTHVAVTSVRSARDQLTYWSTLWSELDRIPVYLECPTFSCDERHLAKYERVFSGLADKMEWRVQARVDSIAIETLTDLRDLGLRVVDVGLESGSPRMLEVMGKTRNGEAYLGRAFDFIAAAAAAGIRVKLNLLLYPGETAETVRETESFLDQCDGAIAGVSAGSAIEFPGTALSRSLPQLGREFGTSRVRIPRLEQAGVFPLNLSRDWSYREASQWCLRTSQRLMTAESYFELKRLGYYPPLMNKEGFLDAVGGTSPDALPFRLEPANSKP